MKIKGQKISGPNIEIIAIPRGDGNDIIFKAQAVLDTTSFDKLCPLPKPPRVMRPGGVMSQNVEDDGYKASIRQHSLLRTAWMVLESLKATEELEWETVDPANPDTWLNYETELKESGFSVMEVTRIINGVMTANALDEDRVNEARERFLALQQVQQSELSSRQGEQNNTPSGEPAN